MRLQFKLPLSFFFFFLSFVSLSLSYANRQSLWCSRKCDVRREKASKEEEADLARRRTRRRADPATLAAPFVVHGFTSEP